MPRYRFTYNLRRWSGAAALVDQLAMKMAIAELEHEIQLEDRGGYHAVRLLIPEVAQTIARFRLRPNVRYLSSEGPWDLGHAGDLKVATNLSGFRSAGAEADD